ncbi:MAG: radical SAM family heme chaperone HemW [Planctomycetes bacterium]|nr:radical SAM family heme chaperone HemW [Planctomycetota bacterium]
MATMSTPTLDATTAPTSLYVHVPFCIRRCAYCDFATAPYDDASAKAYVPRLLAELERVPTGAAMRTVFFGGGTPTALNEPELEQLLAAVRDRIRLQPGFEWTCEANPESVTPAKARLLREHGVNRVSLGAQSFQLSVLSALGRDHSPDHVFRALDLLRAAGFERLTLDLMFAAPGETNAELERDLDTLTAQQLDHVSAYCLTYEPGTPLTRMRAEGRVTPQDEDAELVQYRIVRERLAAAGLAHYEISNYAREGQESRHNLVYWRGEEYFGIGLGAGSYESGTRRTNTRLLPEYLGEWGGAPFPPHEAETLGASAKARERVILGLRLRAGIDPRDFTVGCGGSLEELYRDGEIESLIARGVLEQADRRLRLTARGVELADEVFVELV